jgi:hypothetical protein
MILNIQHIARIAMDAKLVREGVRTSTPLAESTPPRRVGASKTSSPAIPPNISQKKPMTNAPRSTDRSRSQATDYAAERPSRNLNRAITACPG